MSKSDWSPIFCRAITCSCEGIYHLRGHLVDITLPLSISLISLMLLPLSLCHRERERVEDGCVLVSFSWRRRIFWDISFLRVSQICCREHASIHPIRTLSIKGWLLVFCHSRFRFWKYFHCFFDRETRPSTCQYLPRLPSIKTDLFLENGNQFWGLSALSHSFIWLIAPQ